MSKSSRKTNYKIPSRREIMSKYGLSEKQFENLRRRTGERIKNAQLLYNIPDSGIPRVNQLIDYALKEKRQKIYTFENILQTPATHAGKISARARRVAARNITGRSATPHNMGFDIFSRNIHNFNVMRDNLEKAYNGGKYENVDFWQPGAPFGTDPAYRIINSASGRKLAGEINAIWGEYNGMLQNMDANNANDIYLQITRRIMEKINYGTNEGLIVGSND